MNNTVMELGAYDIDNHPEESFDLIWTVPPPYEEITACHHGDVPWPGTTRCNETQ
jgi:hypothetical protein